jgi:hypothetical protein
VDKLPEERAHFAGPPPTCLLTDLDAAAETLFVGDGSVIDPSARNYITELGAHQCVFVRRAASKAALPPEFTDGLCFTVEVGLTLLFRRRAALGDPTPASTTTKEGADEGVQSKNTA